MGYFRFRFRDFFSPDEPLSEWVAILALAFNDLSLLHEQMQRDAMTEHRFFYWLRLSISHFGEAGSYLVRASDYLVHALRKSSD